MKSNSLLNKEWRREKNKNADNTVQKSIDGTKQIKRKQEIWTMKKRKSENADGTKQIADDTKQIKDDTKQNFRMKTYVWHQRSQEIKKIDYKWNRSKYEWIWSHVPSDAE
ncbi:Type II restriction enzyme BanI [Trichinella pseudospiralis]